MTKQSTTIDGDEVEPLRLDLNRRHTDAEIALVRLCFACTDREARGILGVRLTKARLAEVRGMLDAAWVERDASEGRKIPIPQWLKPQKI